MCKKPSSIALLKWTPKIGHRFKLAPDERGRERWAK
jgi:hypothetical protein